MIQHRAIGLLYTRTCPLACGHCITESSPQAKGRMRPEQVRRYLPAIRRFSPHLSFTGGEPLLYHREILTLTAEAKALGLEISVVTGAGWLTGEAMARRRVDELVAAGISRMVISWDRYHEVFSPREHARILARAACAAGIAVDVRTVVPADGIAEEYQAVFRGLLVRFESTSPLRLGAARVLPDSDFHWQDGPPKGICNVVLRPVIEPDGTVYACCGPGHFARRPSPLVLGNAEETPLDEILARGARDAILEAISLIGPHGLYRLLQGRGGNGVDAGRRYAGVCDLCLDLNGSPETVAAVRQRLEQNDAQILLAAARMWAQERSAAAAEGRAFPPSAGREAQSNGCRAE